MCNIKLHKNVDSNLLLRYIKFKVTKCCNGEVKMRNKLINFRGKNTITKVAKDLGITRQMLSAIENGTRTPSLELANRIANYYSSTIEDIFFEGKCN